MSERKAVIKNADMSEDMQQDAVDCASQALEKYNVEKASSAVDEAQLIDRSSVARGNHPPRGRVQRWFRASTCPRGGWRSQPPRGM